MLRDGLAQANGPAPNLLSMRVEWVLECTTARYSCLFLMRIGADVGPRLIELRVGEHVLPRRHRVAAVAHRGLELLAILAGQSPQVWELPRAHQIVAVADRAIGVVDGLAGFD